MQVLGVDGYTKGWVAIVSDDGAYAGAVVAGTLSELASRFAGAEVIGVDVPIGLPSTEPRPADGEAKRFVGPRRSSVFPTPPREALEAESYADARRWCREHLGRGLSAQSYALRGRILEADALAADEDRLHEVHPEVSFRALAGAPLAHAKKTWNGQMERLRLLEDAGIAVPRNLDEAGRVPPDDVLDAAVAAWTATRIARGEARTLPADPPTDPRGRPAAIWY